MTIWDAEKDSGMCSALLKLMYEQAVQTSANFIRDWLTLFAGTHTGEIGALNKN